MIFKIYMTLATLFLGLGMTSLFAASLTDPMKPQFPSASTTQDVTGVAAKSTRKTFPRLSIESITIIGSYRIIQIEGKSLRTGDTVRGAKLVEIMNDKALFLFQGKQYVVQTRNQKAKIIPLDHNIEGTE